MSGLLIIEDNKQALKHFYEKKDPERVKNVEPLFLRWDEDTILDAIQKKYGEIPNGWMSNGVLKMNGDDSRLIRSDSSGSDGENPAMKPGSQSSATAPLISIPMPPSAPPPLVKNTPPPPPPASAKPKMSDLNATSLASKTSPQTKPKMSDLNATSLANKHEEDKARQALIHKAEEERNRILEDGKKRAVAEARAQQQAAHVSKSTTEEEEKSPAVTGRKTGFFGFGRKTSKIEKTPPKTSSLKESSLKESSPPSIKEEPTTTSPPPKIEAKTTTSPTIQTPATPASALNIGAGASDGGYKKPPRGSPELEKFEKMRKAGLPQGAIENAMIRDGFHPAAVFDDPLNNPTSAPKPLAIPKPAAPPDEVEVQKPIENKPTPSPPSNDSSDGGGSAKPPPGMSLMEEIKWKSTQKTAGGGGGGGAKPPPPPGSKNDAKETAAPKVASGLAARQAMLAGVLGGGGGAAAPKKEAQAPAKKWGKVDTEGGGSSSIPVAAKAGPILSPDGPPSDLSKYEKMAKMLPQGAVENAMVRDGIDPGYLFEKCETVKSDKKPIKSGGAGAVVDQSKPIQQSAQQFQQPQQHVHQNFISPPPFQQQGYQSPPPPQVNAWIQVWSPEHNTIYYTNTKTGESSWLPPPNYQPQGQAYLPPPIIPQQQRQIVVMLYNFTPTGVNPQEMAVFANDQIEVYNIGVDGWLTGRCLRTGMLGLVPQNYTR